MTAIFYDLRFGTSEKEKHVDMCPETRHFVKTFVNNSFISNSDVIGKTILDIKIVK